MRIDFLKVFLKSTVLFVLFLFLANKVLDYTGAKLILYALSLAISISLTSLGIDYIK
jgi:hypothetical protein